LRQNLVERMYAGGWIGGIAHCLAA
jgi:hypothetical protein